MDADLSHPPESLPEFLREIESCDVVLGSRYLGGITVVNWPIERILLSYFGNAFVRAATGLPIRDLTGGFRIMRREALLRSGVETIRSEGYSFQIELNYRLARSGARIREIPFFFLDRKLGVSKLTWRVGFETLWISVWLRLADALGRLDRMPPR
jgi:dolichol-phosphate mannosyltransferase